jgi:hypothetical protein
VKFFRKKPRDKIKTSISSGEKKLMQEEYDVKSDMLEEESGVDESQMKVTPQKLYPSDILPTDFYQYKKMRIIPDATADFGGVIDKDMVLSNLGGEKPNLHRINFVVETLELVNNVFVVEKLVQVYDSNNNLIVDEKGNPVTVKRMVFDDTFHSIRRHLLASVKCLLTGSRAMGSDREAVLDITTTLKKDIMRKREQEKRRIGL